MSSEFWQLLMMVFKQQEQLKIHADVWLFLAAAPPYCPLICVSCQVLSFLYYLCLVQDLLD